MSGKRADARKGDERALLTNYVREWRKHRKLTLEQLAERANLSVTTVSEIERHKADFTGKTLRELAGALETSPAAILSGPPTDGGEIWAIWDDLGRQDQRREATAVLKALRDSRQE